MTTRMTTAAYRKGLANPKRRPPRQLEFQEQCAVILWASARYEEDPIKWRDLDLLHCSLNGVPLTKAQAGRAKAQGMKAGVYDLLLPVPIGGYHGLFIEMKSEEGRESDDQKEFGRRVRSLGYKAVTCYGAAEARLAIREYYEQGAA